MNITPKTKSRIKMMLGLMLIALIGLGLTNCIRKRRPPRDGGQRPPTEEATIVCREYDETELFNFLHPVDTRNLSTEVPVFEERRGNSEPLDYSPLEGFHITAERDAFKENTVVMMTPKTTATEAELRAYESIENEGYMLVDCYDVDAGLDDDEVMPGEYTVTIDLSVLDIDPSLYPYLSVFRIGDNGSYYEYSTEITDGQLVYRSNQNCSISVVISVVFWTVVVPAGIKAYINASADLSNEYFYKMGYDLKKDVMYWKGNHNGVTFKLKWVPKDIGMEAQVQRVKQITEKYENMKNDLIWRKRNEKDILGVDKSNPEYQKICAEVALEVREAMEKDEEYNNLGLELYYPDAVVYAAECIREAITYLKETEHVKMPTGLVEFVSVKGLSVMAEVVDRPLNESYVKIKLNQAMDGDPKHKSEFLITLTHEFLHVCQPHYRAALLSDSNRYDEMVAVWMEGRALKYYFANGLIKKDETPVLSTSDYWTTLKLPIDKYDGREEGRVLRHEGYNLGALVSYIQERVGGDQDVNSLMCSRCYIGQPGVSKPLMYFFGIPEEEFDVYYRGFAKKHKQKFADHYDFNKRLRTNNTNAMMRK